jgi:branched-subunit amino acid ABC-type transport system permease component/ABC-type branched-subunit amino acid transport system ATPase component
MTQVIQLFLLGLASGSLYALNALGIIVVNRTSGVINLANGAFAMLAGYLLWSITAGAGLPAWLAVLVAIVATVALALVVYLVVIRPLEKASSLARIVATLAVYIVISSVIQLIFGPVNKVPTSFLPTQALSLFGVQLGLDRLIIIGFSIVVMIALWAVYRFTSFGLATTAVSENPRALAALGHRVEWVRAGSWMVAGALGAIAGLLVAPITQLTPTIMLLFLVPSLAAAIIGGMRSFPVALLAGMLLGAAQVLVTRFVVIPGAADAVPFLAIVIVLVGLGRSLPIRSFVNERLPRVGTGRIAWIPVIIAFLVIIALALTVFDSNLIAAVSVTAAVGIIALSQIVITGYAGQLSLAQMSMAGVGGLAAALASSRLGAPILVAILVAVLTVIPLGIIVGLPAVRTRGTTLAVATLGFAVAINSLVLTNTNVNGGLVGITLPNQTIFGLSLNPYTAPLSYMIFAMIWFTLMGLLVTNLRRGRSGRRLLAVRSNERAASALGINVGLAKIYAFTLAAMIAAVGGVVLVYGNSNVVVSTGFDVMSSISTLAYVVLGGIGYIGGALVSGSFNSGSLPTTLTSEWLGGLDISSIVNAVLPLAGGFLLILQIRAQPGGIVDSMIHGSAKSQQRRHEKLARARAAAEERGEDPATAVVKPNRLARLLRIGSAEALRQTVKTQQEVEAARSLVRTPRGAALVVHNMSVRYGNVVAVDGVSFEIRPGEVFSIIGPNGAGKTSIMDGITGFSPMSGTLGGSQIDSWPAHRRARAGFARSFQSLELLEDMSVLDNLKSASDPQDLRSYLLDLVHPGRGTLSAATVAAIDAFGLQRFLASVPTDLPYGDRHLVAIARAVAAEPSVLLLDEPAAGLSEAERKRVGELIRLVADEWGIAVLLIEHDVELVRRVSDRVLALDFGRPIAEGTPHDVLADPKVVTAYLGGEIEQQVEAVRA